MNGWQREPKEKKIICTSGNLHVMPINCHTCQVCNAISLTCFNYYVPKTASNCDCTHGELTNEEVIF